MKSQKKCRFCGAYLKLDKDYTTVARCRTEGCIGYNIPLDVS